MREFREELDEAVLDLDRHYGELKAAAARRCGGTGGTSGPNSRQRVPELKARNLASGHLLLIAPGLPFKNAPRTRSLPNSHPRLTQVF